MAADESSHSELSNTGYEIFIGALSVLSLVNIVLLSLLRDEGLQTVVYAIDVLLSVVFLIDFLARLRRGHRHALTTCSASSAGPTCSQVSRSRRSRSSGSSD